jgi:methionyl-tRNA synthetase
VPANEFLNLEGEKISTSRNWAIWMPDVEERYPADQLRYYLVANAPEGRDANWIWADFVQRNNSELVANWGNLANRVLNIAHRNFGAVPEPGELTDADRQLEAATAQAFQTVTDLLEGVKLKAALTEALALSQLANQYLSEHEPWKLVKTDRARAATVLYTALRTIDTLKLLLSPFLPNTSQQLHELLGYTDALSSFPHVEDALAPDGSPRQVLTGSYATGATWALSELPAGRELQAPVPLFKKLEESVAAEELERLKRP